MYVPTLQAKEVCVRESLCSTNLVSKTLPRHQQADFLSQTKEKNTPQAFGYCQSRNSVQRHARNKLRTFHVQQARNLPHQSCLMPAPLHHPPPPHPLPPPRSNGMSKEITSYRLTILRISEELQLCTFNLLCRPTPALYSPHFQVPELSAAPSPNQNQGFFSLHS